MRAFFAFAGLLAPAAFLTVAPAQPAPSRCPDTEYIERGNYCVQHTKLVEDEWPNPSWDFTIKRKDGVDFDEFTESNVRVLLNEQPVKASLTPKQREPRSILMAIDRSGSMVADRDRCKEKNTGCMNKLRAARESLKTFIDSLAPEDSGAIAAFDRGWEIKVRNTGSRADLIGAADGIGLDPDNCLYTHLYDAFDSALAEARGSGIRFVILLSDGRDQRDPKLPNILPRSKEEREQKIIKDAFNNDPAERIRIFTIGIGVEGGEGHLAVDLDSLRRISEGADGFCTHIDINDLNEEVVLGRGTFEEVLKRRLDSALRAIKNRISYTYSLRLALPPEMAQKEGKLDINVSVPDGQKRWDIPFEHFYHQPPGAARPRWGKVIVGEPVLIKAIAPEVTPSERVRIYLWMWLALGPLLLLPRAADAVAARVRSLTMRRWVVVVKHNSPLVSKECPSEGDAFKEFLFKEADKVVICSSCKTPHHLGCWTFNDHRCMKPNCTNEMRIPQKFLLN